LPGCAIRRSRPHGLPSHYVKPWGFDNDPDTHYPPDALIKDADNALYEAKKLGKTRTVLGKCHQADNFQQLLQWKSNKPIAF